MTGGYCSYTGLLSRFAQYSTANQGPAISVRLVGDLLDWGNSWRVRVRAGPIRQPC